MSFTPVLVLSISIFFNFLRHMSCLKLNIYEIHFHIFESTLLFLKRIVIITEID